MADITPDFNICLKAKGAQAVLTKEYHVDKINSFMQEAYRIVNTPMYDIDRRSSHESRMPAYKTSPANSAQPALHTSPPLHLPADDS